MGGLTKIQLFILKHRTETRNCVANALSRRASLLSTVQLPVSKLKSFCELHVEDEDFASPWTTCTSYFSTGDYSIQQISF